MTKPISTKQLLANRENARKSAGPKKGRGNSRATGNLLTHGLLAKEVVVKHGDGAERKAAFNALLAALCDELEPQGCVEEILVERIATSYWRLRRALRYEMGAIRDFLDNCHADDTDQDRESPRLDKNLRQAREALAEEQRALDIMAKPHDINDPHTIELCRPALELLADDYDLPSLPLPPLPPGFSEILVQAGRKPEDVEAEREQDRTTFLQSLQRAGLTGQKLHEALREAQRRVVSRCRARVDHCQEQIENARRQRELRHNRRALTACLPNDDRVLRLVRYETMLDCQLHRALSELRRRRAQHEDAQ